ncbi:MAG: tetratricopeptide repeat protein [Dysgonamonadaceae bacterium]|nr:tetratricopeptide repeat protein [Dysgonamonadaceae bacterium]
MKYNILALLLLIAFPAFADGKKFDYFFLEGLRLKENEQLTDACAAFVHALKIDSTSSVAWAELSDCFSYLEKDSLATDALEKAVRFNPDNFEYKTLLANLYRDTRKDSEAIALYEELLKEKPDKYDFNFYLSELYLKMGDLGKSISALDDLENNIGMNEPITMQKVNLYNRAGQPDKAVNELQKLAGKYPRESHFPLIIGDYYLSLNKPDSALFYYKKAYAINPEEPRYPISMANYYEAQGQDEAAKAEIINALKNPSLDIDNKLPLLGGYINRLNKKKKDLAIVDSLFQILIEQEPNDKDLNSFYGQYLMSRGKTEEAKARFRNLTETNPDDLESWKMLLKTTADDSNTDELIDVCDKALALFPDTPDFYFYKGSAQFQNRQYEAAQATLEEGIELVSEKNPSLLSLFYGQLGDLFHQQGKTKDAYEAYDKALELNPNNFIVLNNYAYFLSLENRDLDKAEQMITRCLKIEPNNPTYIDTYAWIFFQKGSYSLARFYIENAIANGGDKSSEILEHYGDILFKSGDTEKAVEEWTESLKIKDEEADKTLLKRKIKDKNWYEDKN